MTGMGVTAFSSEVVLGAVGVVEGALEEVDAVDGWAVGGGVNVCFELDGANGSR